MAIHVDESMTRQIHSTSALQEGARSLRTLQCFHACQRGNPLDACPGTTKLYEAGPPCLAVFAARTQPYGLISRLQATSELAPVAACHDRAAVVYDALRRSVYACAVRIALSEAPSIPQDDAHWRSEMGFALCPWPGNHWGNIRTVLIDRRCSIVPLEAA
jgi:hypothetical protein